MKTIAGETAPRLSESVEEHFTEIAEPYIISWPHTAPKGVHNVAELAQWLKTMENCQSLDDVTIIARCGRVLEVVFQGEPG
jgi:hypothetical protein